MQDFKNLIKLLCDNEVDFVIIGGFAAAVHGVSLLTQDMDLSVSFDKKNFGKLLAALKNCHPIHRQNKQPITNDVTESSHFKNLYLITDFGSLDLLGEVAGIGPFSEVLKHSIEINLFNNNCRVLDIDALIRSKREMKRPKDKETIIQLKAIKERLKDNTI